MVPTFEILKFSLIVRPRGHRDKKKIIITKHGHSNSFVCVL